MFKKKIGGVATSFVGGLSGGIAAEIAVPYLDYPKHNSCTLLCSVFTIQLKDFFMKAKFGPIFL